LIISDPVKEEGEKKGQISGGGLGTHLGLGYRFGYYLDVIGSDVLMNLELSLSPLRKYFWVFPLWILPWPYA